MVFGQSVVQYSVVITLSCCTKMHCRDTQFGENTGIYCKRSQLSLQPRIASRQVICLHSSIIGINFVSQSVANTTINNVQQIRSGILWPILKTWNAHNVVERKTTIHPKETLKYDETANPTLIALLVVSIFSLPPYPHFIPIMDSLLQ